LGLIGHLRVTLQFEPKKLPSPLSINLAELASVN
jgi:hypothetical protein